MHSSESRGILTIVPKRPRPRLESHYRLPRIIEKIAVCLICDEDIYPHSMYDYFSDGYGHTDCITFLRTQARLMRESDGNLG